MKTPWKRTSDSFQSISLLWKLDQAFLITTFLSSLLCVINSYIPVIVLANVLDKIAVRQDVPSIFQTVLIGLALSFLLHQTLVQIDKARNIKAQYLSQYFETMTARTTLNMEYSQLEGTQTKEMQGRIQADRSWGSGFYGITGKLYDIFCNLCGLIVSLVILFPLFIKAIGSESAWFGASIFFTFLISTASSLFFAFWYGKRELRAMNDMTNSEIKSRFHYLDEGGGAISYREMKDILIYRMICLIRPTLYKEREQIYNHTCSLSRLNAMGGIIKGTVSGFLLGFAYCIVVFLARAGEISIGFVTQYAQAIYQAANYFTSLLQVCAEFRVDAKRLSSTMAYLDINTEEPKSTSPVPKNNEYIFEFQNVSFTYPGSSGKAIDHLNLTLSANSRTAIVGLNGSGKTTLIKLLCRLYPPDEGTILINGKDIWQYDMDDYWNLFSVVFQDFSLLSFSLGCVVSANNIYDAERAYDALCRAGLAERLEKMEAGLETVLYKEYAENGLNISGGEAQKIAIARAIYKNAPIVILDEPTAALDPMSEYEVYSKFSELIGEKGVIYISHRLSSCRFCKNIIVMEKGNVIEEGNHDKLLSHNGRYKQLWSAQEQYYQENHK